MGRIGLYLSFGIKKMQTISYDSSVVKSDVRDDTTINYVYAENVTERYLDVYKEQQEQQLKSSEDFVKAKVSFIDKDIKDKDKRVAVTISIFDSKGQVGGGSTANTKKDLNDVLTFIVKKNNNYVLKYVYQGTNKEYKFNTKEKDVFIELTNN